MRKVTFPMLCFLATQTVFFIFFLVHTPSLFPPEAVFENVGADTAFTRTARNVKHIVNDPRMALQVFAKHLADVEDKRTVLCVRQSGLAPAGIVTSQVHSNSPTPSTHSPTRQLTLTTHPQSPLTTHPLRPTYATSSQHDLCTRKCEHEERTNTQAMRKHHYANCMRNTQTQTPQTPHNYKHNSCARKQARSA